MNRLHRIISVAWLTVLSSGCAQWKETPEPPPLLSPPAPGASVAIVDIAFIPIPLEDDAVDWRIWNQADEQCIDDHVRSELASNGLRVGILSGELPEIVRQEMAEKQDDEALNLLEQADLLSDLAHGGRRVHCRREVKYQLPVRDQMRGEFSLLIKEGTSIRGNPIQDPLFSFSLQVNTGPDGETILRLTPEVQHGHAKQSWVSNEQALRLEARRETEDLEHLAMEIPLIEGSVLLVSPTTDPFGLGEKMFAGERVDGKRELTALAIRMSREPTAL